MAAGRGQRQRTNPGLSHSLSMDYQKKRLPIMPIMEGTSLSMDYQKKRLPIMPIMEGTSLSMD
jgi:hypothetical protein